MKFLFAEKRNCVKNEKKKREKKYEIFHIGSYSILYRTFRFSHFLQFQKKIIQ